MSVDGANEKAIRTKIQAVFNYADNFRSASKAVLWVGLLGAAIYIIIGFIPSCPPLNSKCYEQSLNNADLLGVGVGIGLSAVWFYFGSMTLIARAELAAVLANKEL